MDRNNNNHWTSIVVALAGGALILAGVGNPRLPASAQYLLPPQLPQIQQFTNPLSTPIDVTHTVQDMNALGPTFPTSANAFAGIGETRGFPRPDKLGGPTDFLLVQFQGTDVVAQKISPYVWELIYGVILASVTKPSNTGIIQTLIADISFSSNSNAFISYLLHAGHKREQDVEIHDSSHHSKLPTNHSKTNISNAANHLRAVAYASSVSDDDAKDKVLTIRNVTGLGTTIKVLFKCGPLAGRTFAVQPGYELVAANHKLSREDVRPHDGILRRAPQLFAGGMASISQYSVESALQQSSLVSDLRAKQATDPKARKVVTDMARMAAVLNQVNGTQGFTP